jgi:hypothetical protein
MLVLGVCHSSARTTRLPNHPQTTYSLVFPDPNHCLQLRGITDKVQKMLHDAFEGAKEYKPKKGDWLSSYWAGFMSPHQHSRIRNTGVPMDLLKVRLPFLSSFLDFPLLFFCVGALAWQISRLTDMRCAAMPAS